MQNAFANGLWACLEGRGGEVSARNRAAELGRAYLQLSQTGRRRYLTILATEFDRDPASVEQAIAALATVPPEGRAAAEDALRDALSAPRERLLRQFNALAGGVKFLVDLRYDLMRFAPEDAALPGLEKDLKRLLASWFDAGFLELRRIDWNAPASLLERLINYEAVHAIRSWQDLKKSARLRPPLLCLLPSEHAGRTADLRRGRAGKRDLRTMSTRYSTRESPVGDASRANTAVFYSISNAQRGLAGIARSEISSSSAWWTICAPSCPT